MVGSRQGSLPSVTLGGTPSVLTEGRSIQYVSNRDTTQTKPAKPVERPKRVAYMNASDTKVAKPKSVLEGSEVVKAVMLSRVRSRVQRVLRVCSVANPDPCPIGNILVCHS